MNRDAERHAFLLRATQERRTVYVAWYVARSGAKMYLCSDRHSYSSDRAKAGRFNIEEIANVIRRKLVTNAALVDITP